jgi:hypothetical protein
MKSIIKHHFFFIFIILTNSLYSQEKDIYIKTQNSNWNNFSENIEAENNVRFFYKQNSIPNVEIIVKKDSVLLQRVLKESFSSTGIKVSYDGKGNYFLFKNFSFSSDIENLFVKNQTNQIMHGEIKDIDTDGEYLKTYQDFISESVVIGTNGNGNGKKIVKLSGYVTNASDGDIIPQARLMINELNTNTMSNMSGYYEILITPGTYTLIAYSLGMYNRNYKITVLSDGKLNIPLKTKSFLLEEAVVSANRNHNVRSTSMGFEKITAKSIKELPVVLGEPDIIKVALLLPGVQTIGEISSGFNVRGSPADQTMFYINDLPIYNSSHLFGLYTTFSSDAINAFEFYKSNIPIEYGGHLSSIFNIEAKKGNKENFSARAGIGPFSSRLLIEGPMQRDSSSSFLISYRSTYSDSIINKNDKELS